MLRMRRISTSSKKLVSYEGTGCEGQTKLYTLIAMTEDFNVLACCRSVGFSFRFGCYFCTEQVTCDALNLYIV